MTLHVLIVLVLVAVLIYIARVVTSTRRNSKENLQTISKRVHNLEVNHKNMRERQEYLASRHEEHRKEVARFESIIEEARAERHQQIEAVRGDIKTLSEQILKIAIGRGNE